jgi:hypothetical protein
MGQGPVNKYDKQIEIQLGNQTESSVYTSVGTSALAITGLVIGASCFMMNKKRSAGKSDEDYSLIEK